MIQRIKINARIFLMLITLSFVFSAEYTEHTFLFCLNPDVQPLQIEKFNNSVVCDIDVLNQYFDASGIVDIEPWIPGATDMDHDGDIYLNRIYRVYLDEDSRSSLAAVQEGIQQFNMIHSSELEPVHKPVYMTDDPAYTQQCSLPAVKANLAWDFWDIDGGEMPGSRGIILASVDTGVDYTHPDLQNSVWINQAEVPSVLFGLVDTDGDNYVTATEVLNYMISLGNDLNNDGEINLRDALQPASPFIDGIDNDNWDNNSNSYVDDLIGWDLSGWSGTDDNDPYPKEGVPNNSTWAHGTHVSGILAATTNNNLGMASTVFQGSLMSVKCSRENSGNEPPVSDGYAGLTYAAKAGFYAEMHTIINLSWGGGGYNNYEQTVVNTAFNTYGAVVVAAAGNGNDFGGEVYGSHYPSSYNNVVSVAAIGCSGTWGHWATYHETIDLSAPGDDVYSMVIGGGFESWPGSSMASPNAGSAIGLLWSFYPDWDNEQVVDRILEAADPFIYEINTEDYLQGRLGEGMVDAYTAIGALVFPDLYYYNHTVILGEGDGDNVLNPGETCQLRVTLGNTDEWQNAENVLVTLSSNNPGVIITDADADYGNINEGGIGINITDTFGIELASDINLGDVELILNATADAVPGYEYSEAIPFNIVVSLFQDGWPLDTLSNPLNNVETAPLVMDVMGDEVKEIIFGDYSGFLYCVTSDGSPVEDGLFPFDTGNQIWGSPAGADIDNDGMIEVVSTSKSKHLFILEPETGTVQLDFFSDQFLMGTPALGNLDDDEDLEIVFGGFTSSGSIFALNPDGSAVPGFPYEVNEKVRTGVALADFDNNGRDDIVFTTESDHIWLIYDNGTAAPGFPFVSTDKFRSAPSVLNTGSEKIIFAGCQDDIFYAVNADGSERFQILTGGDIASSTTFVDMDGEYGVFFGSEDGLLYGVDIDGNSLDGWPVETGGGITGSPVTADLNTDGIVEIIVGNGMGEIHALNADGSSYLQFPIHAQPAINGTPTVSDTDGDGDFEILIGSVSSLISIDVKAPGSVDQLWYTHRGSFLRSGYFGGEGAGECDGCILGNVNCDALIDILDIVRVVNILLSDGIDATDCELYLADINQDTLIDILDIVTIVNIIIGR